MPPNVHETTCPPDRQPCT